MKQEFIKSQIDGLKSCPTDTLRMRYAEIVGNPECTMSLGRVHMIRRIAYEIQSSATGTKLTEAELDALAFLATKDWRCNPSVKQPQKAQVPIKPGTTYVKSYKGKEYRMEVDAFGRFLFEGQAYKSPTAIAQLITGSHTNGKTWWGIS